MATNALVLLTNNGVRNLAFKVNPASPVKFVSQLVLPPGTPVEIEVETIMPMILFGSTLQDSIISGLVSIAFAFATSNGVPSVSSNFLSNIQRFLAGTGAGWSMT